VAYVAYGNINGSIVVMVSGGYNVVKKAACGVASNEKWRKNYHAVKIWHHQYDGGNGMA
jgi:hypothetical protein